MENLNSTLDRAEDVNGQLEIYQKKEHRLLYIEREIQNRKML